jgi:Protein of unknown function (DUF4245)
MLIALASLLVPILLILGLLRACSGGDQPVVVDTTAAIDEAKTANLFPVLVPQGLGDGWKAVQATFRRTEDGTAATLRLGYLTPTGGQVLLVESNEDLDATFNQEVGADARQEGGVQAGEKPWTSWAGSDGEWALTDAVIENGESTDARLIRLTIVIGRADHDEMIALAASLT